MRTRQRPEKGGAVKGTKRAMPKVLLAGDSISFGYGPKVAEILRGTFEVQNLPANGGTSANLLAHLEDWMVKPCFDIVHLNCGLHDIAIEREAKRHRVPPTLYRENVERIVLRLRKQTPAVLAWATTTPVIYRRHRSHKDFDRREGDVVRYNRIASRIMARHQVLVDDLHRVVEQFGRGACIREDGVHMTDLGNDLLARSVADFLSHLGTGFRGSGS